MEISALPLFHGITKEEVDELLARASARQAAFQKGELLLHRGDAVRRIGLVLKGRVHIIREDFWGTRSIVGLVGPGEVFAESYALADEPLEVSVLAESAGEVLFLDAAALRESRLTGNLLSMLAKKNLMLTGKMRHMACRTTRDKLLSYLSAQAVAAGSPKFTIPMDRQQLADYLAVDRSAMSATLGKLRAEGVLTFHKNQFQLLEQGEER